MATFRKRSDKWQVRIQRKGLPDLAKTFESRRDAESWARQLEAEMDRGAYLDRGEAERSTLGDLLRRYRSRGDSPRTGSVVSMSSS